MRKIAIIGSGIAGMLTAHGLLRRGYEVTVISERSADDWLTRARPTGTAGRFGMSIAVDSELGLDHWKDEAPAVEGVHVTFSLDGTTRLLTLAGRFERLAYALDTRMMSARWLRDFEARGGSLHVEHVTVERLETLAAWHDLVIVCAGRADLANLFERDAAKSIHDSPQRKLAMVCVEGPPSRFDGIPFLPVKFNLYAPHGEMFIVPYHHKDKGRSWNLLFEAKPGGSMDRFDGVTDGETAVARAIEIIRDIAPWDYEWAKNMKLSDENGWLVGGITPAVRSPVARLPSGKLIACAGDTYMSIDPIGGQGANNGTKLARHLAEAIHARGTEAFDEAWLRMTFDSYYERHGGPIHAFNNLLLEPLTPAGQEILIAQYGTTGVGDDARQRLANWFVSCFDDPHGKLELLSDKARAKAFIAETTGQSWLWSAIRGRFGIAKAQLRQRLGFEAGHPRVK